jgi:hypothetical protein
MDSVNARRSPSQVLPCTIEAQLDFRASTYPRNLTKTALDMTFHALHGKPTHDTYVDSSGQDPQWIGHQMDETVTDQQLSRRRTILMKTPALMIWSFLSGIILALGHHLYYASRAGTIVHDSHGSNWAIHSQEWILRFGLAFAFLVKGFFIIAVGLAYTQCVWFSVKHRGMRIGGLDALFSAIKDPRAFRQIGSVDNKSTWNDACGDRMVCKLPK